MAETPDRKQQEERKRAAIEYSAHTERISKQQAGQRDPGQQAAVDGWRKTQERLDRSKEK